MLQREKPGNPGVVSGRRTVTGKKNCWDVMECGQGPGKEGPVCAAATDRRLDGVHGGVSGGRACWMVAGSFCFVGTPSGTFARRMETCIDCRFYRMVKVEEGERFISHWDLLIRTR